MFLLLDKKKGVSSFKAINNYAKENGIKKIGHTGTLDPLATGLLLIATDTDTKLIDYVDKGYKKYIATMKLGVVSNTFDIEGVVKETGINIPSKDVVEETLSSFKGEQQQLPPQFSAKKINGQPAYKAARQGINVELKTQKVNIKNIKMISFKKDVVVFETTVSRGTYIRSIIHDFGEMIKCGAIMTELRRTEIGTLTEKDFGEVDITPLLVLDAIDITKEEILELAKGKSIPNKYKAFGKNIIKVNNIICGIAYFGEIIKSIKLFGNKIDTI